jgi:hypothetical protein
MVVVDADDDLPCRLAPELLRRCRTEIHDDRVTCILPRREFETWFVAGAASLSGHLDTGEIPNDPERQGVGKAWVQRRFRGVRYSETIDQAKLASAFDLIECRNRSPSFDKLCRELERFLALARGHL